MFKRLFLCCAVVVVMLSAMAMSGPREAGVVAPAKPLADVGTQVKIYLPLIMVGNGSTPLPTLTPTSTPTATPTTTPDPACTGNAGNANENGLVAIPSNCWAVINAWGPAAPNPVITTDVIVRPSTLLTDTNGQPLWGSVWLYPSEQAALADLASKGNTSPIYWTGLVATSTPTATATETATLTVTPTVTATATETATPTVTPTATSTTLVCSGFAGNANENGLTTTSSDCWSVVNAWGPAAPDPVVTTDVIVAPNTYLTDSADRPLWGSVWLYPSEQAARDDLASKGNLNPVYWTGQ